MMRIITGRARGVRLATLEGEATRPTAERTKEALFSMIQFDIEGRRVFEPFGGSGQLSLEALSRGALFAVIGDSSRQAIDVIKLNAEKCRLSENCRIVLSDALALCGRLKGEKFDLVFLDPPYALGAIPNVLRSLLENGLLKPTSIVVCESASPDDVFGGDDSLSAKFTIKKSTKHGIAHITLLVPETEE
jgi:16S rRNA (guanine(966)-N(2))-methyltransferase RsmD